MAAGGTHSVVLTREGHVWTWGQPWPPGDMYGPLYYMILKIFLLPVNLYINLVSNMYVSPVQKANISSGASTRS